METIRERALRRKVLITAHRGMNGGNIPCNSIACYKIAHRYGADIIELDITASKDGELFMLHPGMEPVHLKQNLCIGDLDSKQVKEFFLYNQDITQTQYPIATLDETLEELAPLDCFINVDKFWDNPDLISKCIRRHGMADRILVKTGTDPKTLDKVEKYASDMQYMSCTKGGFAVHEDIKRRNINYVGVEALFNNDECENCSDEFIEMLHKENRVVWANAIVYDYKAVIASTHTDDESLLNNPDDGWGWFAKKGFDIIQTDWVSECDAYLREKGYRV